jgi:hypothetical protein
MASTIPNAGVTLEQVLDGNAVDKVDAVQKAFNITLDDKQKLAITEWMTQGASAKAIIANELINAALTSPEAQKGTQEVGGFINKVIHFLFGWL